jgi:hypothetical protein
MRKALLLAAVLLFFAQVAVAYAHPPSDIKITFDPATKKVNAVIMHRVNNVLSHYIKKVVVTINGKAIIEDEFFRQDNKISQTVTYVLPDIKDGDVISVEGYCSISGSLTQEITIGARE